MYYRDFFFKLALIILKIINDFFEENISLENNILEKKYTLFYLYLNYF